MIFLLLLVGSILIFLNVRALRKEKDSFQFTLNNAGNDMEEFEVQIGALRREFTETILELQIEIEKLNKKEIYLNENQVENQIENKVENKVENKNQKIKTTPNEKIIQNEKINKISTKKSENNTDNSVKINEIEKLIAKGLTIEEISQKLGMGKGEVLLIKQLYLK
jgi:TolA-binding protein